MEWDITSLHSYNNCAVKLYDGINLRGHATSWILNNRNLVDYGDGWNDRAMSLRFT